MYGLVLDRLLKSLEHMRVGSVIYPSKRPEPPLTRTDKALCTAPVGRMELAVVGSSSQDVVQMRESAMQQRRADQQLHRHDQIWTKDPHGGSYRKASHLECAYCELARASLGHKVGACRPTIGRATTLCCRVQTARTYLCPWDMRRRLVAQQPTL